MKNWLLSLWISIGIRFFAPTFAAWVALGHTRFIVTPTTWTNIGAKMFNLDVEEFKAAAYNHRIRQEAAIADEDGYGDAYRYGSDTAAAEQKALEEAKRGKKKLPGGLVKLGMSPEERRMAKMLENDDLLITNMVKQAAKKEKVEIVI
jgi:hypothetical protein